MVHATKRIGEQRYRETFGHGKTVCTFSRTMLIARKGHSVEDRVNY